MKKKTLGILFLILFFALFLRLPQVLADQFTFVFDMGRDMLWTRDMVILKKPYLIGPWGSLQGVFFGPAWYYLLSIPFFITGGDPRGSVFLVLFFNLITITGAYFLGKKVKDEILGLIFALLIAVSSLMISLSTFAFHSNILPFTTLIFVWSLYEVLRKRKAFLPLAALTASFNFHFEPATAIFTTLSLVVFLLWQRKFFKDGLLLKTVIAFLLPFVPQMVFELRHKFLQTRALMAYFQGTNESLAGKLPLFLRINDRAVKFLELFSGSVISLPLWWTAFIFGLVVLCLMVVFKRGKAKEKSFIKVNLLTLGIPFLAYIFLFPPELKRWYLCGLSLPFIFFTGLVIDFLWRKNFLIGGGLVVFLIFVNSSLVSRVENLIQPTKQPIKADLLANQKKIINWIYKDAEKKPFKVFVYTAPIYDYHYQYLFWWYGRKKDYYWPEEYSYLAGKKDHVSYKEKYLAIQHTSQPLKKTELFYLIIEPDEIKQRIEGWRGHFSESDLLKREIFGEIIIEKRNSEIPGTGAEKVAK